MSYRNEVILGLSIQWNLTNSILSLSFSVRWPVEGLCSIYCKEKLLWWEMRNAVIYIYNKKLLGAILTLYPFSQIIIFTFSWTFFKHEKSLIWKMKLDKWTIGYSGGRKAPWRFGTGWESLQKVSEVLGNRYSAGQPWPWPTRINIIYWYILLQGEVCEMGTWQVLSTDPR